MMYDQIPEQALAWLREGKTVALATVMETWGSAPRQAGAQMAVSSASEMAGSVSGGCVEGAVVAEALEAMEDGKPRLLTYGVSDNDAFGVGLACGGTIRILVEPVGRGQGIPVALLETLVAMRAARKPVIFEVATAGWARRLVLAGSDPDADARLRADKSGLEGDVLRVVHNPPLRLAVVGAVHIAQALIPMARLAGYDAVLIDPRDAFATAARFPGERILTDWPDDALRDIGLDARTAVVTLSHDPKIDDPAIMAALAAPVFYLGCLGSVRTHAKRLERLRAAGVGEAELARIHGPAGLNIGAKSPSEIAVSVLAQMTAVLRRPGA